LNTSGRTATAPAAVESLRRRAAQRRSRDGGEAPEEVARRWGTQCGFRVEAPPERDLETLDRIGAVREATSALHER
jgi:hypothetical protein